MSEQAPQELEGYAGTPFRAARKDTLLQRTVPVAGELRGYRAGTARGDLIAALTVAALAIPSAMAYAELSGLSPIAGLYALLLPAVAYTLLGSSRQLIIGPEGSISALVGAAVLGLAATGSTEAAEVAATLALLVGACFLVARIMRLGWIADYLSRPVLIGYIHGVAVVLVVAQLEKLLGIEVTAGDPLPQLVAVVRGLGDAQGVTVTIGAIALAILLDPALPRTACAGRSDRRRRRDRRVGVARPRGRGRGRGRRHSRPVCRSFELPSPSVDDALTLLPAALGIFLVCFADEVLTARSFAGRHDQHIRVDQELLAMGAAQAAAGVTQGLPIGASGSRTAVNDAMGARSQIAGLLAAVTIVVVLLFLTGPIADLPTAVLGAVIVSAAVGLVEPAAWRGLWQADHVEATIAAVTAAGVVTVGVLEAILFAVGLSIVDVVRRSARPHDAVLGWVDQLDRWADVAVHPSARVVPGVVVYRLDDRLFFANQSYVKARVREAIRGAPTETHDLVLDAEGMTDVDSAGLAALGDLSERLARDRIVLRVARMKTPIHDRLEEAGVTARIGRDRFHPTVRAAVRASTDARVEPRRAETG